MIDGFNEPGKILPSSSPGIFNPRKVSSFSSPFLPLFKKKRKPMETPLSTCLLTSFFPFDSYRRHPNQSARSALHRLLRRSDAESAALLSLLPFSRYRRTHAHLHIVEKNLGRYVSSRNLPITPVHPTPPPVFATVAKPVAHNWEKYTLREIEGKCEDTR